MNKKEFFNEFKEMCEYFNSKIFKNRKITTMYYEKVKHMKTEEFKKVCKEMINNFKFMPRIADFDTKSSIGHHGRCYTKEFLEILYDVGGISCEME
ncbi:MAG: hypothetical protein RSD14_04905 [Clostridia bacterium]